jgi:hypothetical protein
MDRLPGIASDGGYDRWCGEGRRERDRANRASANAIRGWGVGVCLLNLLLLPLTLAMALAAALAKLASDALNTLAGLVGRIIGVPFRAADALIRGIRGDKRRRR